MVSSSHAIICMANKRSAGRIYFLFGLEKAHKMSSACLNTSSSKGQSALDSLPYWQTSFFLTAFIRLFTSTDLVGLSNLMVTFHASSQQGMKKEIAFLYYSRDEEQ
eukprot:8759925-Ditylum_brightwellii.AAC.1